MPKTRRKVGILIGGGPAPGINSVIAAASIRAISEGFAVVGIEQGFRWIMRGDITHIKRIKIDEVSRLHFGGGSYLGIARHNPTKDPQLLENCINSLTQLGVDKLITIGGDDTAFSAMKLEQAAAGRIRVVHVPKTIDNDLDLPQGISTFGYQTARHMGVNMVKNLMTDARSTERWYLVVSMGRKAGHLALGIGKAAAATVTIIPEEFPDEKIRLSHITDIVVGAIIKRLAAGRPDGVVILAEGLMERLDARDLRELETAERDEYGNIRLGEIQFEPVIKKAVLDRLAQFGIKMTVTTVDIGYELRCAEPIPYDMEYTRDLGYCAAQFIINGGSAAMVAVVNGHFKPLYFKDMVDPETGLARVRMVDVGSEYYHIARRYMIRLNRADFNDKKALAKYAAVCGLTPEEFYKEFHYLVEKNLLYRIQDEEELRRPWIEKIKTPF
ncbi:MAG: 6-phosphofructokinase [Candidatus Latescibacterota bacterium]|nr:MAG: 6-phosphofructokinase [Candidatus Latescibacterota bacterium]